MLPFREPAHHPPESSVPGVLLFLLCIVVGLSNCELLYTQFKQVNLMMTTMMMMMMVMMVMMTMTWRLMVRATRHPWLLRPRPHQRGGRLD